MGVPCESTGNQATEESNVETWMIVAAVGGSASVFAMLWGLLFSLFDGGTLRMILTLGLIALPGAGAGLYRLLVLPLAFSRRVRHYRLRAAGRPTHLRVVGESILPALAEALAPVAVVA
jgi:hypothetical protein